MVDSWLIHKSTNINIGTLNEKLRNVKICSLSS